MGILQYNGQQHQNQQQGQQQDQHQQYEQQLDMGLEQLEKLREQFGMATNE